MKNQITYLIVCLFTLLSYTNLQGQNGLDFVIDTTYGDPLDLKKMAIANSSDETLYIGYYNSGLGIYANNEFSILNMQNSELPSNKINHIYADFNEICISTDNGLAIYDNGNWEFPGNGLAGYYVESSYKDNSLIYALCSKDNFVDSLAIYDGIQWEFIQFPGYYKSFLNNSPIEFHNGTIYFGTRQEGLFSYDGQEIKHLLYNLSVNDLQIINNKLWISLNTANSQGEYIMIYDINNETFRNFSKHFAFEPTHKNKGAAFSKTDNGGINIIYTHQTQLIVNRISGTSHDVDIYTNQQLSETKYNATDERNGRLYFCTWSHPYCMIIQRDKHQSFLSGFWSKNIKTLDINKVGATVKSYGSMFWDGNSLPRYQVPIGNETNSIFASGIWVGGYDQSGDLHLSAVRYNENQDDDSHPYDFAPGVLYNEDDIPGVGDTLISNKYDRVWKIDRYDVEQFNYATDFKSYEVPEDMEDWPGNSIGANNYLAPFFDQNNDGIYNSNDGDYPKIMGDQMLWWLINDNTHPNEETGGTPLGIELHNSFYGFTYDHPTNETEDLINYQTYLNVKIVNRSNETYDSVFIGVWVDADIGGALDDYVGCDVERNSFYFYNADNYDENYMDYQGYGSNPPVQTVTILDGPLKDADGIDNDLDGIVDNETLLMSKFLYYNNIHQSANPATTDPINAQDYYNYMSGNWKDGTPICYGGNGHFYGGGDINTPCNYMFPGDTDPEGIGTNGVPQPSWSEYTENNTPDDRRGLCSIGPFTMEAGETNEITILFAFIPNNGTRSEGFNYQPSLDSLITWYNENRIPSNYEEVNTLDISSDKINNISVYPNPAENLCTIRSDKRIDLIEIYDIKGIKTKEINVNDYEKNIQIKNWDKGIYFIRVHQKDQIITRRLIVM